MNSFHRRSSSGAPRRLRHLVVFTSLGFAVFGLPAVHAQAATLELAAATDLKAAAGAGTNLKPAAQALQLTSAVVRNGASTIGAPCPAANKAAPAGSTRTIVICGRNRATTSITPTEAGSSLSGSFIRSVGTFASAPVPAGSGDVVLGQWTDTGIVAAPGTGYKVVAGVGATTPRTAKPHTFRGYSATSQSSPVAANINDSTDEDTPLVVTLSATDGDGDPLGFSIVTGPTHGSLGAVGSPSCATVCTAQVTYTPDADYNGADSFTYKVNDGTSDSTPATVSLTVDGVNDAPSFTPGSDQEVAAGSGATALDSWATAISAGPADEAGQTLDFNVSAVDPSLFSTQPAISPAGRLTFTVGSQTGSTTVNVTLHDDGGTANGGDDTSVTRSFTITLVAGNALPTADPISDSGNEDASNTVTLSGNDSDGSPLSFSIVTGPQHGSLGTVGSPTCDAGACAASVTYTPDADYNGSDSFTYKVNDGTVDSTTATVSLTIVPVNDAPSFTKGDNQTVLEDAGVQTVEAWANAISAGPGNESTQNLDFVVTTDNDALFASPPLITGGGDLSFTSAADANGVATLSVKLTDDGGTANGGVNESATKTFTITVSAVNDTPSFTKGADQTLFEDAGAQSVSDWATAISKGPADESAQTLNFSVTNDNNALFSSQPAVSSTGTLTYTGAVGTAGAATVSVTLLDDGGTANGGDDTSDVQTFTITVNGVNSPPSFTHDGNQTVLEDSGPQSVAGFVNSTDPGSPDESGQTVTVSVTGTSNDALFSTVPTISADGTLSYTPLANANGTATVSARAVDDGGTANGGDDTGSTMTFTITVTAVNDAPAFTKGADQTLFEDAGAQSVSNWATAISNGPGDESAQTLNFSVTNDNNALFSSQPAISSTGTLTYTSALNTVGVATVSVSLSDNGGTANGGDNTSNVQTFTIAVNGVNDEPSFTHDGNQTALEDVGAQTVNGFVNTTSAGPADESAQTVTVSVVDVANVSLFAVPPSIDSSGTLTFTPAADAFGSTVVTARAVDSGGIANGGDDTGPNLTFTITLTPVNDEPSFTKGADQTVNEDAGAQSVSNWATAISKGPANESAQTLSFTVANDNNALFSSQPAVSATGTLTFTSAANKYGSATVSVSLADNGGTANGGDDTSPIQTFTITVNPVNDAPVAVAKNFTVQSNMKISLGGLLVGASDPNDVAGDPSHSPSFTLGSISVGAACIGCTISNVNNAAGTFDFDPPAGGTGTFTATYTVVDNGFPGPGATSASQTITFTVNGPVIWFVDADASTIGTGRLSEPFNNLASATTAMGTNTNQRIFVEDGNVTGNVTLQSNGWLISDAVTGAGFDTVMNVTPPAGTIARPAINGSTQRTLTGTVTLGTSSVARGFNLTPTSGNRGLVASGKTGLVVNQMSITTVSARAVDLASSSGTFTLTRVSASGGDRGISLVSTNTSSGSFTITGTGTAGSGGVISDSTALGTSEGGIYLVNTRNVSLDRMTISGNDANGVYGNSLTDLTLANSTISNNGAIASSDSGLRFVDLLGTSALSAVDVGGSARNAAWISNSSGSAAITVSNSTFTGNATQGAIGIRMETSAGAVVAFTSTNNAFSGFRHSFNERGLYVNSGGTQSMDVTVTGGSYTGNDIGLQLVVNGSGGMDFSVNGGTVTGCASCYTPVSVGKFGSGTGVNPMTGTVTGMTITNGNSTNAPGIDIRSTGPGAMRVAVTNNNISQVGNHGIEARVGNSPGGVAADLTITGNTINKTVAAGSFGINVEAGSAVGDQVNLCAHIANNIVTNPAGPDVRVANNYPGTLFRIPGYLGPAADTTAVQNFLQAQNTAADATATNGAGAPGFSGGGGCQAP